MHFIESGVLQMLHLIQKGKYVSEFQVEKHQELSGSVMYVCTWCIKIMRNAAVLQVLIL